MAERSLVPLFEEGVNSDFYNQRILGKEEENR